MCRNGTEQSPIDIVYGEKGGTSPANFEPLVFVNYDTLVSYNLTNNGHTGREQSGRGKRPMDAEGCGPRGRQMLEQSTTS